MRIARADAGGGLELVMFSVPFFVHELTMHCAMRPVKVGVLADVPHDDPEKASPQDLGGEGRRHVHSTLCDDVFEADPCP